MPVPSPTIVLSKLQCARCRSINKIPAPYDVCSFSQNAFLPGSSGPFAKLCKNPSQNVCVQEKGMAKCRFDIEVASVEPACVLSNFANRRVRVGPVQRLRVWGSLTLSTGQQVQNWCL